MATLTTVRRIVLALPGTAEERFKNGNATWKAGKKSFAWERPLRASDIDALGDAVPPGPILAIRTDGLEMKDVLLRSDPGVFFTTPHFDGYAAVLIALKKISLPVLRDVLEEAWSLRAPKRNVEEFQAVRQRMVTRKR